MKNYKILFTQTFIDMYKYQLDKYKKLSYSYAINLSKKLSESIKLLQIFPYATQSFKIRHKSGNYRKLIIKKRFLIIFKIENDTIFLLYFIDGRQSLKKFFNYTFFILT